MDNKQVTIFESPQFGAVRTAGTSDEPLFCLTDVAKALDYANPAKAVIDHCKGVTILETPTNGGIQKIKFGRESELYRLIMKSNTEKAEAFQDWVCCDVLPSIRKTGRFETTKAERGEIDSTFLHQKLEVAKFCMDSLKMNEVSRLNVVEPIAKQFGIELPDYVQSNGVLKSATELLRRNKESMSIHDFNRMMVDAGYLKECERTTSSGKKSKFKTLTDKGLEFGENLVSKYCPLETQPEYYSDKFKTLLSNLKK